jgi:hypothetical protein
MKKEIEKIILYAGKLFKTDFDFDYTEMVTEFLIDGKKKTEGMIYTLNYYYSILKMKIPMTAEGKVNFSEAVIDVINNYYYEAKKYWEEERGN